MLKSLSPTLQTSSITGTLGVPNGGTGLTSLANYLIPYGNGTGAYSSSSALEFDGTNLITSNNLLINTLTPGGAFNNSLTINSGANSLAGIQLVNNATGSSYNTGVQLNTSGLDGYLSSFNGSMYFQTNGYNIRMVIGASGGISIGTTVDKGSGTLNMAGLIFPQQSASAPTYQKGAIYFDTTLNKLRVGGATGWETITSI
jgi:hypothetical protein